MVFKDMVVSNRGHLSQPKKDTNQTKTLNLPQVLISFWTRQFCKSYEVV